MTNLCAFGDSITWGMYDPEGGGWATRLRNYYEAQGAREVDVYNLGISGDSTDRLIYRLNTELTARRTDAVILAIGINDSRLHVSENKHFVSKDDFRSNLGKILAIVREKNCRIMLLGLTPVDESKVMPVPWAPDIHYSNAYIEAYDAIIKEVAAQHNHPYIPLFMLLELTDLHDGLHPNSTGHQKIFEVVKKQMTLII